MKSLPGALFVPLTLLSTWLLSSAGQAAELYVDPKGVCGNLAPCFRSLKTAIQAASPTGGDHVNLFVATYSGAVLVDRPLVLRKSPVGNPGDGMPMINAAPGRDGDAYATLMVTAGPTVVQGLQIRATNKIRVQPGTVAISIGLVSDVTISDSVVIVEGTGGDNLGIYVGGSKNVRLVGNQIRVRGHYGILLNANENSIVSGNVVHPGIYEIDGRHDTIVGNHSDGVGVSSTLENRVIGNMLDYVAEVSRQCRTEWFGNTFTYSYSAYGCPVD